MWTKARCLAALEAALPDAYAVDVSFRKPILLPGRVELRRGRARTSRSRFAVRSGEGRTDDRSTSKGR